MKNKQRPSRRKLKATYSMRYKTRVDWLLDKLNDVVIAAYALLTGEQWIAVSHMTAKKSDYVAIFAASIGLILVWLGIGIIKGELEENCESN